MKNSTNSSRNNFIATTISLVFILLILILLTFNNKGSQIYPSTKDILEELWLNISDFKRISAFLSTFGRVALTLAISFILALLLSLIYYYKRISYSFIKPILVIAKSAPVVAISVYIFILAGGGLAPYIIAGLVTFPIMLEGMVLAIDQVPNDIVDELALIKSSKIYKFINIYLPLISKSIIGSLLQTIGLGFKVMIMGEYICHTKRSIGVLIYNSYSFLEMDVLIAVIIEVVIIVVIWELIIKKFEKKYF